MSKYKARLVVKGYQQGQVELTYSPVVDFTTVRTALAVAVRRGYIVHQMDVTTAFLHGKIDEEIYVTLPTGIQKPLCKPGEVLRLSKGLYGLKQASKLWNEKWRSVMASMGFICLRADECVFKRGKVWILLYVDDVIVMGGQLSAVEEVKKELK